MFLFPRAAVYRIFATRQVIQINKNIIAHGYRSLAKTETELNNIIKRRSLPLSHFYSNQTNKDLETVQFEDVKNAIKNDKVLIVDVREPDEVKEHGKIPSSINIPVGSITSMLGSMSEGEFQRIFNRDKPTQDTEMIFYCMVGKRSSKAQQSALNLGYKNAKNYWGSWNDWKNQIHASDVGK